MKRAIAALLVALGGTFVYAQEYVPGEIVVKFEQGREIEALAAQMSTRSRLVERVHGLGAARLRKDSGVSMQQALAYWRRQPFVEYAEPNYIYRTHVVPNDPLYAQQWGLPKVSAPAAWDLQQGNANVVIAIVDTGVALAHPDLVAKIVPGRDFVNNDSVADDDQGHGTHCAGIAAATTNNGLGVAGLGWACRIMPVKVLASNGSGTMTNVANGITWAADNGAKVISLSLGGSGASVTLENAVNYAWGRGALVVAAAGNSGVTSANYPAFYTNAVAVAASNQDDSRASFSNFGSWVDVAAPGVGIQSTFLNGTYRSLSGTSMATPMVAGLAGLLWGHLGTTTNVSLIRQRIEDFTDPVPGGYVAKGRINAHKALNAINPPPPTEQSFLPTAFQVVRGTLVSGSVNALASDDAQRLVVRSTTSGTPLVSEVTVDAGNGTAANLAGLRVMVECQMNPNGTLQVSLWNWGLNRWDVLSNTNFSSGDSTVTWTLAGTGAAYQSSTGNVRVRLFRSRNSTTAFENRFDRVRVTKLVQQ